jgi:hypothetical protein
MSRLPAAYDHFPSTEWTWLATRVMDAPRDGGVAAELRARVMERYAEPLRIYAKGSSLGWLDEAEALVNGFFASRLARGEYLVKWFESAMPLRRFLANGMLLYLREERRGRMRRERRDGASLDAMHADGADALAATDDARAFRELERSRPMALLREDQSMNRMAFGIAAIAASASAALGQNLLLNGGLEGGSPSTCSGSRTLGGGSTSIPNWVVVGPQGVDWIWFLAGGACCDAAPEGSRTVDLNGPPAQDGGAIRQTIATVIGKRYRVSALALANGCCAPIGTPKTMRITTGSSTSDHTLTTLWGSDSTVGVECDWGQWTRLEREWVADSASTVVEFRSLVLGNAGGFLIDDLSVTEVPCPADVDDSGTVNGVDLAVVLTNWGTPSPKYPGADVNDDGVVDGKDLATVLAGWGACP